MSHLKHAIILVILACAPSLGLTLDLQLKDKIALVTGSTAGIGYATAEVLLKEGADVIVNGRTQASVDKAVASLKASTGRTARGFAGDMTNVKDTQRLVEAHPRVDILVNNVGRLIAKEFTQTTDQDWYETFDLNVMSGVRLSRAYLPGMRQRNDGRIIFISSESGVQIPVESIHYGMSKAAVIAIARGLAELTAGTKITVNSVLPGPTRDRDDPRAAELMKRMGAQTFDDAEKQFITTRRPTSLIKRFADPTEVATLIAYVASPLSSATTGASLRVDGGVVKSAF
jgi:NAD(P)-dependent dehydrogenase (short-subunit alcohol dehydrogenase family)